MKAISIKVKIVVAVAVVLAAMTVFHLVFTAYTLRSSVEEAYVTQLRGMTTAINGRYEESHSIADVQQIFDYITYKNPTVMKLTLYGLDGVVLASTERTLVGRKEETMLPMLTGKIRIEHIHGDPDGIPKVLLMEPMLEDGQIIGYVELLQNASDEERLIQSRIERTILVNIGTSLIIVMILSAIIRSVLVKPLMTIRSAALSVKHGKAYEKLELHASQELTEVGTAFNEMVETLERQYKQIVEAEKMSALGSLVAGVAHEINTPIGVSVTAASYLEEKTADFERQFKQGQLKRSELELYLNSTKETTRILLSNLQRSSELIRSFKQVSVDQSSEERRRFAVVPYIRDVVVSLQPQLKRTNHTVEVEGDERLILTSYPGALSQIITNLLMNSLLHAFEKDEAGWIRMEAGAMADIVYLTYEDNGRGMTEDIRARMFDPFFTTNRSGGGTGLGMHIVYNLVTQRLGGTIACTSEPGKGTKFRIELPNGGEGDHTL